MRCDFLPRKHLGEREWKLKMTRISEKQNHEVPLYWFREKKRLVLFC